MKERSPRSMSRRSFLATGAALTAVAGLPEWFVAESRALAEGTAPRRKRRYGANDLINIGCIGPGGSKGGFQQGLNDTRNAAGHPGTKVVAVCDVDATHRNEAVAVFGPDCKGYSDFRELLARRDIDAVVIGTPDHWHAFVAIAAMRAGKDVYCEKPLTLTIDQGKHIVKAWRETGRIFQVGSQQRSDPRFRLACELVRNARLGKIKQVITHLPTGAAGGPFDVQPVPSDLDWDFWLGPCPKTDYVPQRTHGTFRHWLEYSGGMLTDWGAHHNDIAQWGLGTERSGPTAVEAVGSRRVGHECYNAFVEYDVSFTYPGDISLLCTNTGDNGVDFIGENGTIFVTRGSMRASDPSLLSDPLPPDAVRLYVSDDHMGNFLDCTRTRKQPICDPEIGHRSVTVCHLANICLRLGGYPLKWDPARESFVDNREADAMLKRPVRGHWRL